MPINLKNIPAPDLDAVSRILERAGSSVQDGLKTASSTFDELKNRRAERASNSAISKLARARSEGDLQRVRDALYLPAHLQTAAFTEADFGSTERILGYGEQRANTEQSQAAAAYNRILGTSTANADQRSTETHNREGTDRAVAARLYEGRLNGLSEEDTQGLIRAEFGQSVNLPAAEKILLGNESTAANIAKTLTGNVPAFNADEEAAKRAAIINEATNVLLGNDKIPTTNEQSLNILEDAGFDTTGLNIKAVTDKVNAARVSDVEAIAAGSALSEAQTIERVRTLEDSVARGEGEDYDRFVTTAPDGTVRLKPGAVKQIQRIAGSRVDAPAVISNLEGHLNAANTITRNQQDEDIVTRFSDPGIQDRLGFTSPKAIRAQIKAKYPNVKDKGRLDALVSRVQESEAFRTRVEAAGIDPAGDAIVYADTLNRVINTKENLFGTKTDRTNRIITAGANLTRGQVENGFIERSGDGSTRSEGRDAAERLNDFIRIAEEEGVTDERLVFGIIQELEHSADQDATNFRDVTGSLWLAGGEQTKEAEAAFRSYLKDLATPGDIKAAERLLAQADKLAEDAIAAKYERRLGGQSRNRVQQSNFPVARPTDTVGGSFRPSANPLDQVDSILNR